MNATAGLVGRDAELAALAASLDAARAGAGSLVLVSGEPGIGKTALVEALAELAAAAGVPTVWGRCWEGGGAAPFWPWTQVLRTMLDDALDLASALGEAATDLAQLVPEISTGAVSVPGAEEDRHDARFRLFDAVGAALAATDDGGLVVVLEDLHAADEGSLELLRYVVRGLERVNVLVAATYREADLGASPARARLLGAAARQAPTIRLRGLAQPEVVELLDRSSIGGDPGLASLVHDATDGNPFLVQEAARVLAENRDRGEAVVVLPAEALDLVRRRLERLDPATTRLLAVAALLGREFDVATLGHLAEVRAETVLDALAEAQRATVVEEVGLGRWSFQHALLREALGDTLTPAEAVELHGRAADAIAAAHPDDTGPHVARIAHHLIAAGDPRAASAAARAGQAATAVMAYEEAARWYEAALQAANLGPAADRRVMYDLLLAWADAKVSSGDLDEALEGYDRAFAAARALGSVELLAEAAVRPARTGPSVKTPAIVTALDDALCELPDDDSPLRAQVLVSFARALGNSSIGIDVLGDINDQGLAMARRLGPHSQLWDTLWTWHQTSGLLWDVRDVRREVGRQLIALAEESGDPARLTRAREAHAVDRLETGDLATARMELDAAARDAERLRQPYLGWSLGVRRVQLALLEGRLADAEALAGDALAAGRRCGLVEAELAFHSHLVSIRRFQGRWDELETLTEDALRRWTFAEVHCAEMYPAVQAAAQFRSRDEGRAAMARFVPEAFVERHSKAVLVPAEVSRLCCVTSLAELWWLLGDGTWAPALYEILRPHAARHVFVPTGESRGGVSRYLGQLAALQHRYDEAEAHFRAGHAQDAGFGAPIWQAHGWWDHARMLVARNVPGDADRAAELLTSARDRFRSLGMDAYAAEAERRLARLPRRPERAAIARDADHWTLEYGGKVVRMRDSKGVAYLVRLLRHPGRAFPATELADDTADPERARQSVSRAVKATIERLDESHPGLAQHLRATVRTGVESVYVRDPRAPVVWE